MKATTVPLLAAAFILGALLWAITPSGELPAQENPPSDSIPKHSPEQIKFFEKDVLPLLQAKCFRCHGADKRLRGNLRLTHRSSILKGGDLGPAVSLKSPETSLLLKAISYKDEDLQMPPKGKLSAAELATLTRWVKMGLPWTPDQDNVAIEPKKGRVITDEERNYWAYRPIERPELPVVKNREWASNPIDLFILAKLEENGLTPNPPADGVALLRRAYYDVTGLPPSPSRVDGFLKNDDPSAVSDLINELLASPQYGEKWGRHWLDVVRYAETNGYERDGAKPFAWRYRDYVIRSFNQNKSYDRFVREQLAGDEIPGSDPDAIIATGFYRLGIWNDEPIDRAEARYNELDDIVATTSQVFLGMTMNCARCHDHKIDPIPQKDYYRLLAFFQDVPHYSDTRNVRSRFNVTKIDLPESKRTIEALSVNNCTVPPPQSYVMIRGNPHAEGDPVDPGFPVVLIEEGPPLPKAKKGDRTSGRRSVLADWLVSDKNPLTARVIANRIWQYHFGRGVVPTANDFGKFGEEPTHPKLLDWLASELMQSGWSIKHLHRLIMSSSTYRTSSRGNTAALRKDPANRLFWRFNARRLTAEEMRDTTLAVSGQLNLKMSGPSIYPKIPREVLHGQSRPGAGWPTSPAHEAVRRSVYVHVKRSLRLPILENHDQADTDSSCAVRYVTTVPTQALGMLNGDFVNENARAFAGRLQRVAPGDLAAQVRRAIRLATCRMPTDDEIRKDVAFIRDLMDVHKLSAEQALFCYCLMTLNTNELAYVD